jgi:transcriptional regulator with XRE-family HTH domain
VTYGARLRELRAERQLSLRDVEERGGPNKDTMSLIERDVHKPHPQTIGRIAKALGMDVSSLRFELETAEYPLGGAPPSQQLTISGALDEEEQRAAYEATVEEAQRLRDTGWAQMWKALSEWRASKQRGESYATRREYLDQMGDILKEAANAHDELGRAYVAAALTQGGSEASVPSYLREESQAANDLYVELFGLVRSAGLTVLTGDAAAAKQAATEQAATEHAQPETKPHRVEEPEAA